MNKFKLILSVVFLSISTIVLSQTINEAGDAFNNGTTHLKAKNFTSAIEEYKKCLEICNGLDSDAAMDLAVNAEKSLVLAYINQGKALYRAKKFDNALNSFQDAYDNASGDKKAAAKQYMSRVYNSKGTAFYSKGQFADAIASFDKSLEFDAKYVKAAYGKALVYRKQKNIEAFKIEVDNVVSNWPANNKTVNKTKSTASKFFIAEGGKALQAQKFSKAVELLNTGFSYKNGNGQAYYFAAIAYNGLKQWQNAIDAGTKGLAVEKKSKSNLYFEIAKAYEGSGNKSQACSNYKKVVDGPNQEAAKYQIEQELKCN